MDTGNRPLLNRREFSTRCAAFGLSLPAISAAAAIPVVAGAAPERTAGVDSALLSRALQLLLRELPPARAAAIAAQLAGATRSDAYELALKLRRGPVAD